MPHINELEHEVLEAAATVCEALVTFAPEHEKYAPKDGSPCGWCDGLEEAAARIRGLKQSVEE